MNSDLYDAPLKPGYKGKGTIVYEPLSALSLTQRLGRLRFACYQLTASVIAGLLLVIIMLFSQKLIPALAGQLVSLVVIFLLAIYLIGLMVRRLHDMGLSGWWAVFSLVPVGNLLLMLYLLLGDGSSTVNRFGTPNPPPGTLVILAGGLYWALNVLSLLVSIGLLVMAWQFPEKLVEIMKIIPYQESLARW